MCVCVCVCVFVCVGSFSFAKGQQQATVYRKYKPVRITQKEHLLIWNPEITQKPKHLSS